jgi:hypothetical protein
MRTATLLSPLRRTSVAEKTPYVTGGTPADWIDPILHASGEKLSEMESDRSIAELRRRYDTFETVVGMIVAIRSSQPSGRSRRPYGPDKVKLHSLRELINGFIPKEDVIRRLDACDPWLAMRYTRDEILDDPFRHICGLPRFFENYRDEKLLILGEDDTSDDSGVADDDHPRIVDARTGGGGYGQKSVRLSTAMRDRPTVAPNKSSSTTPSDKWRS